MSLLSFLIQFNIHKILHYYLILNIIPIGTLFVQSHQIMQPITVA